MSVTNTSRLNNVKPNIGQNSFLHVMIHTSAEQKVSEEHINFINLLISSGKKANRGTEYFLYDVYSANFKIRAHGDCLP